MVALSFEPLPREFFARGELPPRLQLPRAKFEGLCELGADLVGLLRFDARMVAMSAEAFVRTVLVGRLAAREVHVGPERSEKHPSELQSLMRISYAVFCLKKTK